jgi:4a-hydroxytetrahydrobiopterin dehydratase
MPLTQETCEACRADSPRVTDDEQQELGREIPDWTMIEADGEQRLQRQFALKDFKSALAFTPQVGDAAEAAGHHPAILTEWGKVTVTWWTHAIHGLHRNDYIMAAKSDELYRNAAGAKR